MKVLANILALFLLIFSTLHAAVAQGTYSKILVDRTPLSDGSMIEQTTYIQDFSPNAEVRDLSNQIQLICNNSKTIIQNGKKITVHFGNLENAVVQLIAESLGKSVAETQNSLSPLMVDDVEIFLLPIDNLKFNFTICLKSQNGIFHFVKPYANLKELSLNCDNGYAVGQNIFVNIPHELTHNALKDVVNQEDENENNYPRWFEEGLAEYVSLKVAEKLSPCWVDYTSSYSIPEFSFARNEVSSVLFKWQRNNNVILDFFKGNPSAQKLAWNEVTFYGASYELMRLSFENAMAEKSLTKFFSELLQYRARYKQKLGNKEILEFYTGFFGHYAADSRSISGLQAKINDESLFVVLDLKSGLPKENKLRRYKALSILASSESVLPSDCLSALLEMREQLMSKKERDDLESTYLGLIDTSLAVRLKNREFSKNLFEKASHGNKNKAEQLRKELLANSYRPV